MDALSLFQQSRYFDLHCKSTRIGVDDLTINLSVFAEQIKAARIEGQAQIQSEARAFDPAHVAENVEALELSNGITHLGECVTHLSFKHQILLLISY